MHRTTLTADQIRGWTSKWSPPAVRVVSAFYIYTLVWLLLWVVIPSLVMWSPPVLITSGSMEPGIRAGDVVVMGASDGVSLGPGTVVTFRDQAFEDRLITHRITTAIDDGTYITKGDANPGPDSTPLAPDGVAGVPRVLVSTVGVPLLWIEQGRYALVAAWLIVTLAAASQVLKRPRRRGGDDQIERDPPRDVPRPTAESRVPGAGKAAVTIAVLALVSLTAGRAAATLADTASNSSNSFGAAEWEALVAVDGGEVFSCGVNDEGAVWCWGSNDKGQLGDGTTDDHTVPVQVVGSGGVGMLSGAVGIGTGRNTPASSRPTAPCGAGASTTEANSATTPPTESPTPVQVKGPGGTGTLTTVTEITAGLQHRARSKPTAPSGAGASTTKANSATTPPPTRPPPSRSTDPAEPEPSPTPPTLAAGAQHTCAVKTDGTVWCWGLNNKGQLGNNTTTDSATPVQVNGPGGTGTLTTVTEHHRRLQHTCAVKTDGTVWCWGLNDKGQLGDNTTDESSTPVQVNGPAEPGPSPTPPTSPPALKHTCVVKTDGTVWCWGLNNKGQLGDNTTTDTTHPRPSQRTRRNRHPHHVILIGAGNNHTCAAHTDHTIWCWGLNDNGQLGDNTTTELPHPRPSHRGRPSRCRVRGG